MTIKAPHYQGTTESEKSVSKGRQACSINTATQIKPRKDECLYLVCKKEVKPDPNSLGSVLSKIYALQNKENVL